MPSFADDLFLGAALSNAGTNNNNPLGDPAPNSSGFGPMGRIYIWDIVPLALNAAAFAASQTPSVAGNLTLTAGTNVTAVIRPDGTIAYQVDVPRAVSVTTNTSGTAANFTVTGWDYYGSPMSEIITTPAGAATTNGRKAFYQVSTITVSAGTGQAITVGTTNIFGIPAKVVDAGYMLDIGWANVLAQDTGTFVGALNGLTQLLTSATIAAPGVFTVAAAPATGTLVQFTGTPPGGVTVGVNYYVNNVSATTFRIATTQSNLLAGTYVTTTGSYTTNTASVVTQNTSTQVSPDVRGTYAPSTAANGVNRLVVGVGLTAIQVGPNATALGLLGAAQA